MRTGEDLPCNVHQSPRLPRAVLTPNLHHGRQDLFNPEAYLRQIRNMDVRILLVPKRENPPTITANKASSTGKLVAHFSRTPVASIPQKVSDVSTGKPVAVTLITEFQVNIAQPYRKKTRIERKPSEDWFNSSRITRTGTRQYRTWKRLKSSIRSVKSRRSWSPAWATRNKHFEVFNTSSEIQCLDCASCWEAGIIHGIGGKCMQLAERNRQLNRARYDVLSIPGYIIKKNPTHSARHGPSVRQCMYYKAHDMLRKACKHRKCWLQNHSGKMAWWWQTPQVFVRNRVDWGTDHSRWCNRIGRSFLRGYMERKKSEGGILENLFECRRYLRTIESAQWLFWSEAGMQKTVWRTYSNHWKQKQTNPSSTTNQATAWSTILKASKNTITDFTSYRMAILPFLQDDAFIFDITLATKQRLEVKSKLGFVANIILDWTVKFSVFVQRCHFACRKGNLLAIDGGVDRHTYRAPHFLMHSCCAVSLQSWCQSVQSHIDLHAPAWFKSRSTLSAFRPKTVTPDPRRAMSYTLQNLTPRTGTPSSPFPESVFQHSEQPCEDRRPQQSGALTEQPPLTGCEPNRIAEDWDYRHCTGDGQFTEHEDLRVRPLSFH